jgi:hypothetical protein
MWYKVYCSFIILSWTLYCIKKYWWPEYTIEVVMQYGWSGMNRLQVKDRLDRDKYCEGKVK